MIAITKVQGKLDTVADTDWNPTLRKNSEPDPTFENATIVPIVYE